MKITKWKKSKGSIKEPCIVVGSPCSCGCSPYPFVFIFDGEDGMTFEFQIEKELDDFKRQVKRMNMTSLKRIP